MGDKGSERRVKELAAGIQPFEDMLDAQAAADDPDAIGTFRDRIGLVGAFTQLFRLEGEMGELLRKLRRFELTGDTFSDAETIAEMVRVVRAPYTIRRTDGAPSPAVAKSRANYRQLVAETAFIIITK